MRPLQELLARHPLPDADGSKDDRGHVLIIGGPPSCPGAVVLAATAALRCGAGRVQVAVDPEVAAQIGVAVPELGVVAWNQKASPPAELLPRLRAAEVVVVGPGHQRLDDIVVRSTAERVTTGTVILDAGALPCTFAVARSANVLIAPNPTEAALLLDREGDIDEELLAKELSARLERAVAVRGSQTVIAEDGECFVLDDAPLGLGTPGSGDVFVGILAALVGNGVSGAGALGWAARIHAEAARRLPPGYLAREIADAAPAIIAGS